MVCVILVFLVIWLLCDLFEDVRKLKQGKKKDLGFYVYSKKQKRADARRLNSSQEKKTVA
ncbi:MAG: hypothetical protein K5839_06160 [Treponemataceae bacterium]|nr:hypothetical protein [Treponemataceae bacterium]